MEGAFENILGFNPDLSEKFVAKTKIMKWLLDRVQSKTHDENRCYAAELLSILLQNNSANRQHMGKLDGVEAILKTLSVSIWSIVSTLTDFAFVHSIFVDVTLSMRMKRNSWKIFSTLFARLCLSPR